MKLLDLHILFVESLFYCLFYFIYLFVWCPCLRNLWNIAVFIVILSFFVNSLIYYVIIIFALTFSQDLSFSTYSFSIVIPPPVPLSHPRLLFFPASSPRLISPPHSLFCSLVVPQAYESEVNNEYVIRGNSAILKCNIPSFVADFVSVQAWVTDKGDNYYPTDKYGNVFLRPLRRGGNRGRGKCRAGYEMWVIIFLFFFLSFHRKVDTFKGSLFANFRFISTGTFYWH